MGEESASADPVTTWLRLAQHGDRTAVNALIGHAYERLQRLARRMLRGCPQVRRWEETDDLCQKALLPLIKALTAVQPQSMAQFFGLAAFHTRQALIDMIRHYTGPQGLGAHYRTDPPKADQEQAGSQLHEVAAESTDPHRLLEWLAFHEQAAALPEPERQVVQLHWYGGLPLAAVAEAMEVSERTAKRHWRSARLLLYKALHGDPFEV